MKLEKETQKITLNKCKYSSVIAKASCGKATVSWPDFTFKKLILQSGQKCSYLDFESQLYTKAQTLLQKYYLSQQEKSANKILSAFYLVTSTIVIQART